MVLKWLWRKVGLEAPAPPDTGRWGEQQAEEMLRRKGYRILGRRLRIGLRDEIDLVARDGEILVFVEVKTRRREDFGRPLDSVDRRKRQVLSRAAVRYLRRLKYPPVCFRFDVGYSTKAFDLDRRYYVP